MKEFNKVIGYEAEKLEMYRVLDTMLNPDRYAKLGVKTCNGLLISGIPGVGKTLMAKCFIKASKRKTFTLRKDIPNGKFVEHIKNTFDKAINEAPSIVFLDDLDKFSNGDCSHKNSEEYVTVQSCFDECKGKDVFVIATTNDRRNMPSSLLRKGRFDLTINIDPPKGKDAELIVKHFLKNKKCDSTVNAKEIATLLDQRSCSTLESVINEAITYAGYEKRDKASRKDLIRAFMRLVYDSPESNEKITSKYTKETAYHEAGHTLVSEILEPGSVNFATIKAFKGNVNGFVNFKNNDDYFKDIEFMKNRVMSLLAGKATTEIVFGKVDVGASNDLERAFNIASRFSDDYCSYNFNCWTDYELRPSDKTLERKEQAVVSELEKLYNKTKNLLAENRKLLDVIAERLIKNEILFSNDIDDIRKTLAKA